MTCTTAPGLPALAFPACSSGNSYYGLAIGFTVAAGAFAVGPISGGAFNAAVGSGPILANAALGLGGIGDLWYYWAGPLIGAVLAALAFRVQNPKAS